MTAEKFLLVLNVCVLGDFRFFSGEFFGFFG